jgi:hypothetical protein
VCARVYYSAPANICLDYLPKIEKKAPRMKTTATQPAQPPMRKKTRRPGRGAPIGNRNAAGNKSRTGRPRPAGAGLQALKPGENSKSLFVRLAESDRAKLEKIAANNGQKMSALARDIILDFLAKNNA